MTQSNVEFAQQQTQHQQQTTEQLKFQPAATADGGCDILLNTFLIKKRRFRVLLHYDHIVWERLEAKGADPQAEIKTNKECDIETQHLSHGAVYGSSSNVVHIDDLVRVTKAGSTKITPNNSAAPTEQLLCIHYAARVNKSATDCNRWRVRTINFFSADTYIVHQWHAALELLLQRQKRVQRLLVFINPYGGRKAGLQTYERHCKPLFQLAGIDASCIISQRANQIRDILTCHDLSPYDAVCCVGGDGTVAEVINGLIFRAIHDRGFDMRKPAFVPRPSLPVGIIPAGSTDTVAYSLHGTADVRTAAIHVMLGRRRGLDICSVRNREGILRFCASVFSYGYLGDVAAKSDQYRWMGTKRYEYTGVKTFLTNRGYDAEIRLLLPDGSDEPSAVDGNNIAASTPTTSDTLCYAHCQRCNAAASKEATTVATPTTSAASDPSLQQHVVTTCSLNDNCDSVEKTLVIEDEMKNILQNRDDHQQLGSRNQQHVNNNNSVPLNVDNSQWQVIKGKFFMICGANITCACSRSPNGMSRYSHLGDGHMDLILVRKTSMLNNVRFVINTMGRNGDIRNLPFVEVYRTRQFSFRTLRSNLEEECSIRGSCQPITGATDHDDSVSSWNCDGEVVNELDVIMSSHCQLIDVFMRGPHPYVKNSASKKNANLCCFG